MRHSMKIVFLVVALLGFTSPVAAGDQIFTSWGKAIRGYDPVAYFTQGKPVRGSDKLVHVYRGAAYRFSSEAHLDVFKQDPARYAPQYGGFCAYGVAVGKKFVGDPNVWEVVDGRLYLNLDNKIKGLWVKDVEGNIEKADQAWPEIRAKHYSKL